MSRTFLATMQFDGTGFVGWQRQPAGRSVQMELERVLGRLFGRPTVAHAAGRTDAGVHATGLGVSFAGPDNWTAASLHRALNALLPPDCWIESVHAMRADFHARKSALSRRYRYDIGLDLAAASPFRRRFEWALCRALDTDALQRSAAALRGEHDFVAFAIRGAPRPHYRCRLALSAWEPRPDGRGVSYHVQADRFLHHMVRMLVGTMVDVALGRRPSDDMARLLARGDNQETSAPAPPQGLYFVAAAYPANGFADDEETVHAAADAR
jgi:tRNA pseudouridine38-40 synthase